MSEQPPPLPPVPDEPVTAESTPQPAPAATAADRFHAAATKAKAWALSLAARSKSAAQIIANQTERTKRTQITLPNAYRALGKHVHGADSFRADFGEMYGRIDTLLADISKLTATGPAVEGFKERAMAVAKAAKDKTHAQALQLKLRHEYAELGRAAFEKHGDKSETTEVVKPILDCRARLQALAAEMAEVSKSESGTVLTPKRIAVGSLTIVVVVLLLVVKMTFFGGGTYHPAIKETAEQANKQEETAQVDPSMIRDPYTALLFRGAKQDYEQYGWNTDLLNATMKSQIRFQDEPDLLWETDDVLDRFDQEWRNNRIKEGLRPDKLKSEIW